MGRDLVYLVAVGAVEPRFTQAVSWCVTSLRRWGAYTGEIAVITDQAETIPDTVRTMARLVPVDERQMRDPAHGRNDYDRYLMGRLRVHHLIDVTAYDRVLYVDCDVLAVRPLAPLLDGLDVFRYSREFQPMSAPMYNACLSDAELAEARWRRGINSGVFAAPGNYLGECLDRWTSVLDAQPDRRSYDQAALNALVLRSLIRARPLPAFSVAYPVLADFPEHFRPQTCLLHYCGNPDKKFPLMEDHFDDLTHGRPPRLASWLPRGDTGPFLRRPPANWRPGPTRDRALVVAFDEGGAGVESHSLVNARWSRELQARGHYVVPLEPAGSPRPDVVIHHNYQRNFLDAPHVDGARHVAVRTSDFGPFPATWADRVNRRHDQLWVHSRWIAEQATAGGVDPSRIRVVPHGVDPTVYRPQGPRLPLSTRKAFAILFVGGAARRKGVDILLRAYAEAFRRDDDVCLVIKDDSANAFYREGTERDAIRRLAADPGAPEVLHIDGHLTAPQLAALYRACHVAAFPYRAEGFTMPALEALACGVPTIVPRFGACLDFSDDETSFLIPAKRIQLPVNRTLRLHIGFDMDVGAVDFCEVPVGVLARALRHAYEAGAERMAAKGVTAAQKVHAQFTWRHVADRIEACLREVTAGA